MSLRGAASAKAFGATWQSRSYTIGNALATRLPRFARNDIFLTFLPFKPPIGLFGKHQCPSPQLNNNLDNG
jgi:hypothetical protein